MVDIEAVDGALPHAQTHRRTSTEVTRALKCKTLREGQLVGRMLLQRL